MKRSLLAACLLGSLLMAVSCGEGPDPDRGRGTVHAISSSGSGDVMDQGRADIPDNIDSPVYNNR